MPAIKLPLTTVGVNNRPHYITVIDPLGSEPIRLLADMKVSLDLPAGQRGLHMSRIEAAFHKIQTEKPLPLREYATKLCEEIRRTQEQETCRLETFVKYEHLVSKNVSGRPAYEVLELYAAIDIKPSGIKTEVGLKAPFINACPCTQRWGMKQYYDDLLAQGYQPDEIFKLIEKAPLQAHTNRGEATLIIHSDQVGYDDLYKIIDSSAPIIRELLSGPDEHAVVKEAHQQGLFCEDVIRAILDNLVRELDGQIDPETLTKILVDVDESVHFHNLFAESEDTIGNIKSNLNLA